MSDANTLIVPIDLQAMVLNSPNVSFTRATMSYQSLDNFQSPSPGPFQKDDVDFAKHVDKNGTYINHGVYLRWTLPASLRHGTTDDAGAMTFPPVPDRWLVARLYRPAGAPASSSPQIKAWVVESSYHSSDGTSAWLDPSSATPMRIGRKVEVSASVPWHDPGAAGDVLLRAIAEGCPAFATYQPFNENVLSIHDDLATQQVAAGTMSYVVIGWYADAAKDILADWQPGKAGDGFRARLAALKWNASVAGTEARTTIYQGMVSGVPWTPWKPGVEPPHSPKDGLKPQVAIGNTSVDGVMAFARAALEAHPIEGLSPDDAVDLLEAFQYSLLPILGEEGAELMLQQQIRGHWFGSAHGGQRWTIVDAETAADAPVTPAVSVAEMKRQTQWLDALNADQAAFDAAMRQRIGIQRQLFELWWKQGIVNGLDEFGSPLPWGIDSTDQVAQAVATLATRTATVMTTCADLAKRIATDQQNAHLPATQRLKPVASPRFWAPVDPVIVLSNTAHTMKIDPDAMLLCRWASEVLPSPIASHEPAMSWTGLPALAHPLFSECFLSDPSNAGLRSAPVPGPPIPVAPVWTEQPWQPLYLDWEVEWYPIPLRRSDGVANWTFDGLDYAFVPGMTVPPPAPLQGRSLLTPKPSFELKARLNQFIKENQGTDPAKYLQAIEGVVEAVDQWDFLSQTMTGLNTRLAGWRPDPTQYPDPTDIVHGTMLKTLIGDAPNGPPDPQLYNKPDHPTPSTFEGTRAGQFYVKRLTVVDIFGQTLEVVTTDTAAQFFPLLGDGLVPAHPIDSAIDGRRLVQLAPRVLQPARLNFLFVTSRAANPIAGWILPNHLDAGLAVYGQDGTPLGELSRAAGNASAPVWTPVAGSPYATVAELTAAEPQLGGMIAGLQQAGGQAFADFLNAVDETLWTFDVAGQSNDTFLAALVGRPLAVVTATVAMELQTSAWTDPEWPFTFANPKPGPRFLDSTFAVRLGDLGYRRDGLIGYFLNGKYSQVYAVHPPSGTPQDGYLVPIGPGHYIDLSFTSDGAGAPAALTLLMDPRLGVHAQCGLFPVKEAVLVPEWVDDALASIEVTFRSGPVLAAATQLVPAGQHSAEAALALTAPAAQRGTWSWVEADAHGKWPETPLSPVSGAAAFPDAAPALREGLLKLKGGLGK